MVFHFPETWGPYFLISIQRRGASAQSEIQFASIIDPTSLETNPGDRPVNLVTNAAGGGIYSQEPEEMGEITFDLIAATELDAAAAKGLFQQYVGISGTTDPNAYVASEPLSTDTSWPAGVSRNMDRFRIAVLWTNDAAATTAGGSTAAQNAKRWYAANCLFRGMKMSHSDNMPKYTCTFVFKPYNKAGTTKNYAWQSGDATALVALTAYTTANFPD